ncbi:probable basic-leucine zipper transcription factor D [Scaptodrosophila lebanonensis]|uniref:Probable basic-leucine zipper transcription factor D n=1 Tax=Drosophila lebanonensis TaxID=7225 RepID=A0A6J2TMD2_DROLE|nr:probable basic-leucine zipper transcription factor D [Scaptodrosophila lebanonensis]XP_030376671.1 probable basic-leucine zipper transcription factor D [Scaptodrosophila lebanonensis]
MTTSTRSNTTATNESNKNNNSNNRNHQQQQQLQQQQEQQLQSESTVTVALHNSNSTTPAASATTTMATTQIAAAAAVTGTTTIASRVMQADEDFNIRFVNLVRTHKCLYDKKVPEYRNRDNQEKAWVLISKETRESVIHCKERWRNLRACLSRYIKQQSGSEPQHKPYYLTEHMAFLLPFLKSTRNSLEGNNNLATLYQFSQQQQQQQQEQNFYYNNNNNHNGIDTKLELKQSLSENDDEETIDAFDPAIAASLGLQRVGCNIIASTPCANVAAAAAAAAATAAAGGGATSPALSDTASANTMQNFIPDVQLAESGQDLIYESPMHHHHHHFEQSGVKRIKTECEATTTTSSGYYAGGLTGSEHTDMEFFRSILPDIAALTPQQRRKFKIGILELIDDVVERYPAPQERYNGTLNGSGGSSSAGGGGSGGGTSIRQQRRSLGREWRK